MLIRHETNCWSWFLLYEMYEMYEMKNSKRGKKKFKKIAKRAQSVVKHPVLSWHKPEVELVNCCWMKFRQSVVNVPESVPQKELLVVG